MGSVCSVATQPLRSVVERMAFHAEMGQHEMSIMCNVCALPPAVTVCRIGAHLSYCLVSGLHPPHGENDPHVASAKTPLLSPYPSSPISSPLPLSPQQHHYEEEQHYQEKQEHQQYDHHIDNTVNIIWLCFHGNAESVYGLWASVIQPLSQHISQGRHAFVAVEYPGYVCEDQTLVNQYHDAFRFARPSESAIMTHVCAVYDRLRRLYPCAQFATLGRSIGCGPAIQLSVLRPVAYMCLLAPYLSIMRVGLGWTVPYIDIFDNVFYAPQSTARHVVIVHSEDDNVIPVAHSEQLIKHFVQCDTKEFIRRYHDGHDAAYMRDIAFVKDILSALCISHG